MAVKYLQVYYTGEVFEYSKTPKPEFEAHTTANGTTYRRYYKSGVSGVLEGIDVKTWEKGTQVNVTLKDSEDIQVLQFRLHDNRSNVDTFTESLIRFLPNMAKGEEYWIYPYVISPEDQRKRDEDAGNEVREKYYSVEGVSVKTTVNGEKADKVEAALFYKGDDPSTVIPSYDWKKDRATGKKKPSAVSVEAKNEFLVDKLMDAAEGHLKRENTSRGATNNSTTQQKKEEPKEDVIVTTDDSDLPF